MGLGLPEARYWLLTSREFNALKRRYEQAHHIKPAKSWQESRAESSQNPRMVTAESRTAAIDAIYAARQNRTHKHRR